MKSRFLSLVFVFGVVACTPVSEQEQQQQQAETSTTLHRIFDDYFAANLELNPLEATSIGIDTYDSELGNPYTAEYRERSALLEEEFLIALNMVERELLNEEDQLSYDIFKYNREMSLARLEHPTHLIPLNQMYNVTNQYAQLGAGGSFQPFQDEEDYRHWLSRMQQIPNVFDQLIENMNTGIEQQIVQPRVLTERVIAQVSAHLVDTVQESLFYRPLNDFPENISPDLQVELSVAYEQVITDEVLPAYQKLHDYLVETYLPASRTDSYGLSALPGGEEWYAFEVSRQTTTALTPSEIHNIGLNEVSRIHDEIRAIMSEVGFEGTLEEFFVFTRDDPQFHYESPEAMLADYRAFAALIEERAHLIFDPELLPNAGYEIRRVEAFREQSASSGSYSVPSEDGSRPGIFYLNTYGLEARPTWAKGALTLHEAIPGHHYQLALQRELTELPRFRRFSIAVAYAEGWGLYSETLGDELGIYGPYDSYGQLIAELWRSIRLVVDTGIHQFGWSRQEVLDYMYANAPVAEARAVSEAERFMALPGQATAYKIGQLKIAELRALAEEELGESFSLRDFHYEVLRNGSLPLAILEQQIIRWIAEEKS
ncbi:MULTISPECIES: DUF885 family protein [Gammaproteobacteria]|uniref:DUF885 domain-containing protein n=1 Tax=Gammaproteobacteria TaxID=1236 RepID=UPI000DD0873B|nr:MULTISPECIES: DUF885 domain-containing protein [Gammaproteobacteria]RTE87128.1 DUF885 domain-containing protein [Aliidiomarina sp. B3213]TCZ93084.1 DUF885 domain-containing protein [Lysobacter sp. N42]